MYFMWRCIGWYWCSKGEVVYVGDRCGKYFGCSIVCIVCIDVYIFECYMGFGGGVDDIVS